MIKSNNPHLAGGEIGKKHRVPCGVTGFDDYFNIFMDRLKDSHLGNHAKNYPVHTNRLPVIFPRQFLGRDWDQHPNISQVFFVRNKQELSPYLTIFATSNLSSKHKARPNLESRHVGKQSGNLHPHLISRSNCFEEKTVERIQLEPQKHIIFRVQMFV